ncbi:MAG: RAMP superfamily CRISPR-associated protein [Armatimonadota bacterium]
MPDPIDVTFELVTPAYAGGADRAKTDGLRPPTLKALLRFWWRTMHPEMGPGELFEAEEAIFGSTSAGQGLRVVPRAPWPQPTTDAAGTLENDPMHVYMAYGPVAWDSKSTADPKRTKEGKKGASVIQTERVRTNYRATFGLMPRSTSHVDPIMKTLWLLSAFAGFGSRSRRGWGSLRITSDFEFPSGMPDPHSDPKNAIPSGLSAVLGPRTNLTVDSGSEPHHTAFSPAARVIVGSTVGRPEAAHRAVYEAFRDLRKCLGKDMRSRQGGQDYQKRRTWLTVLPSDGDEAPLGVSFGLPLNAQFSPPSGPRVDLGAGSDLSGRRASQVFMKVIGRGEEFAPVVLWLPAVFLPPDIGLYVSVTGKGTRQLKYPGHTAVTDFLTRLTEAGWQEVTW